MSSGKLEETTTCTSSTSSSSRTPSGRLRQTLQTIHPVFKVRQMRMRMRMRKRKRRRRDTRRGEGGEIIDSTCLCFCGFYLLIDLFFSFFLSYLSDLSDL